MTDLGCVLAVMPRYSVLIGAKVDKWYNETSKDPIKLETEGKTGLQIIEEVEQIDKISEQD